MNNGLCGDPKALPAGDVGHSAHPDAVWALRLTVRPTPDAYVQSGVYEVNQGLYSDANFRSGWKFDSSRYSGVDIPAEAPGSLNLAPTHCPVNTSSVLGTTAPRHSRTSPTRSRPRAVPSYRSQTHTGNFQGWALGDQMLVRNRPGNDNRRRHRKITRTTLPTRISTSRR